MKTHLGCCLLWLLAAGGANAADWPQLQRDSARTGRSPDEVALPYRARWVWFGPAGTLRNRASKPHAADWTHDLTSGVGKSYPLPATVPFTLAGLMQPLFFGEEEVPEAERCGGVVHAELEQPRVAIRDVAAERPAIGRLAQPAGL